MIAGALLVAIGCIGVLVNGRKIEEVDPSPDERINPPHQQMPPLPRLLNSERKRRQRDDSGTV
ncbi:hypothetical protein CWO91_13500 [Bradyrhizobium genosp. SA-3]|nr:hypothetical protein CWO91_13500 [Bradyrhizobium genosp. SA-3]